MIYASIDVMESDKLEDDETATATYTQPTNSGYDHVRDI